MRKQNSTDIVLAGFKCCPKHFNTVLKTLKRKANQDLIKNMIWL